MKVGSIVNGRVIGRRIRDKYMWHACGKCGGARWVKLEHGKPRSSLCQNCSRYRMYKEGVKKTWNRYKLIYVPVNSPYRAMANKNTARVREHRLVMAIFLGRPLKSREIVHHINGNRDDNRLGNLQLVSDDKHKQITILENKINLLEKRVTILEAENVLLKESSNA